MHTNNRQSIFDRVVICRDHEAIRLVQQFLVLMSQWVPSTAIAPATIRCCTDDINSFSIICLSSISSLNISNQSLCRGVCFFYIYFMAWFFVGPTIVGPTTKTQERETRVVAAAHPLLCFAETIKYYTSLYEL